MKELDKESIYIELQKAFPEVDERLFDSVAEFLSNRIDNANDLNKEIKSIAPLIKSFNEIWNSSNLKEK